MCNEYLEIVSFLELIVKIVKVSYNKYNINVHKTHFEV